MDLDSTCDYIPNQEIIDNLSEDNQKSNYDSEKPYVINIREEGGGEVFPEDIRDEDTLDSKVD